MGFWYYVIYVAAVFRDRISSGMKNNICWSVFFWSKWQDIKIHSDGEFSCAKKPEDLIMPSKIAYFYYIPRTCNFWNH